MRAADLPVTLRREFRPDQVPFVGEEEHRIIIGRQVDTGAVPQGRHSIRRPDLLAGAGFETDEFAGSFRRENVFTPKEGGLGVAQNPL